MPLDWLTRLDPLRRIRCPFCFETFAACEMHLRCNDHYCKTDFGRMIDDPILSKALNGPRFTGGAGSNLRGPWWVDPRQDRRRGFRRHLDWMVLPGSLDCPNCKKPTDVRLCPRCHARLPDSVVTLRAGHIAIFGPQSVGKTTYVTVLIHELEHRVGPARGFTLDPLTDEIRDRYDREYHELTYGGGSHLGVGEDADDGGYRRSHSATPSIETNRSILQPLVYRVTARKGKKAGADAKGTLLSFFDTAGEDWEMNLDLLRGEARYLGQARGLLFLLDPLRIREVALDRRLRLTEKEVRVPPADYLNDARKLATFFGKTPVKTPLAIALNKLDRWGRLMEPGTALHGLATSAPDRVPDRSLDNLVHDEVQSALRKWGMTGFLDYMALHFPGHRFFACSSLGDAAQEDEDAPQPLPTPLLIERPVLWLLERQKVIEPEGA